MHLLYVDESGTPEAAEDHFVLGGVAVGDVDVRPTRQKVERLVRRHLDAGNRQLELHAGHIRGGKGPWRGIPHPVKQKLLRGICNLLGQSSVTLFGAVWSPGALAGVDPLERTYEELLLRYTQMLVRLNPSGLELGLVIADEARYESVVQPVVQRWRDKGTRFAKLTRLVEVPLFVDSKATRMIQLADFVAHGLYRYYRMNDGTMVSRMWSGFDTVDGVLHGLVHLTPDHRRCPCPACKSRR